jgi:hypothetical protein
MNDAASRSASRLLNRGRRTIRKAIFRSREPDQSGNGFRHGKHAPDATARKRHPREKRSCRMFLQLARTAAVPAEG